MDATEKLLKKIHKKDKRQILAAIESLLLGKIQGIKLANKNQYRLRVGKYRILYEHKKGGIEILEVRRRNEGTYK